MFNLFSKKGGKTSKKKKAFKSPSAFSVLFVIIAVMAGLTWLVPSGRYIDGKYIQTEKQLTVVEEVQDPKTQITVADAEALGYAGVKAENKEEGTPADKIELKQGVWDFFMSIVRGMISKIEIIMFILVLGGFLGVVMKTKALDAALGGLLNKMKGREKWLIPILMTLFAIGGTTYGMQEEAVAFYALVVPIMLAAGYNTMTSVMVIVLGAGSGVLASTVNPFSTGIAAENAGVSLGNILGVQGLILVLSLLASIVFTMRYAAKVKAGKIKEEDGLKNAKIHKLDMANVPAFTLERKFIAGIFATTFFLMVLSLIPWSDFKITVFEDLHTWLMGLPLVGEIFAFTHAKPFGAWYFNEISAFFLISAALMGIVYHEEFKKENTTLIDTFVAGVADMISVALIIAVAAAIGVVMTSGGIQDTIVFWGENMLRNVPKEFVGVLAYIFYLPMSFIIPSSSGLATATMPIIAPVVESVGASKEAAVVAFATASGVLNMFAPTIASLLAGLQLAGVSYRAWVKRSAPIMAIFVAISLVVIFLLGIR